MHRYDIFAIDLAMLVIEGINCKCKWTIDIYTQMC